MIKRLALIAGLFSALAGAQTTSPILQPHVTFVDAAGLPCTGCKLYSYVAGTTTPLATYSDAAGVVPNTNPVIMDVAGGAQIWLGVNSYKFILKTALGTTVWTVDNVSNVPISNAFLPISGGTVTGPLTVSGTTTMSSATGSVNGVFNTSSCSIAGAPSWCAGSDMGAWINAAIVAAPFSGAEIFVAIQPAGGCWTFSTPIAVTTKTVRIVGAGTVGTDNGSIGYIQHSTTCLDWIGNGVPITISGTPSTGTRMENLRLDNHGTCTTGIDIEDNLDVELSHVGMIDPTVPCTTYGMAVGMTGNVVNFIADRVIIRGAAPIGIQTGQISAKTSWRGVRSLYNSASNLVLGTATLSTLDFGCDDCTFEQNTNLDSVVIVRVRGATFLRVYTEHGGTGNAFHIPATASLANGITIIPGYINATVGSPSTCYVKSEISHASVNIIGGKMVGLANPGYFFCNNGPLTAAGFANIIGVYDSDDTGVSVTNNWPFVSSIGSRCTSPSGYCGTDLSASPQLNIHSDTGATVFAIDPTGNVKLGANVVLPSTLTGIHGTGVKVQASDGSGASGNCAKFAADGSITDFGSPCVAGGGGSVTNFAAAGASWPTWLVPTVTNSSTTPTLTVAASAIPNASLANSAVTVNGHAISLGGTGTVSASDLTTGTLPHAQLPALVSGDIPSNAANTSGTAGGLSGTPAIVVSSARATTFLTNAEFSNGTCTTALTIDPANGNRQKVTLTNADTCALTFTQPASGTATVQLKITQSAVSTFNGGISGCKWPGGAVPTITQTTGAVDMLSAYLDGTNAYCQIAQSFQ